VNYVRQFPEQIIKPEKCTYASIARRKLGTDRAKKNDRIALVCSATREVLG
jgi:hypothetical protein